MDGSKIRRTPTPQATFGGFRRYGRKPLETELIVMDDDGWELSFDILNISPTGVFVQSDFLFDLGEEHTLVFRDPTTDSIFRLVGKIVRVETGGAGVFSEEAVPGMAYEFVDTRTDSWQKLCELVEGV